MQATETRSAAELVTLACEVKVSARRGLTLVDVYGGMGVVTKFVTMLMRKSIYKKYDKVINHLKALLPPAEPMPAVPSTAAAAAAQAGPSSPVAMLVKDTDNNSEGGGSRYGSKSANVLTEPRGEELRPAKRGEKVHCVTNVQSSDQDGISVWWSAGAMLEFYTEANQSTTAFLVDKPSLIITAIGLDAEGNLWTGHIKGLVRVRRNEQWEYMAEDASFASSAVRCMDFDESGFAWVGDDSGRVKVRLFENVSGRGASHI